jgi:hypothetical protein
MPHLIEDPNLAGRALRGDTPRVGADKPARVPSQAGAWRVPPVALTLMNQVCAWKHDTDLGNRLTDQTVGLLGREAVLTIIGLKNAGNLLARGWLWRCRGWWSKRRGG